MKYFGNAFSLQMLDLDGENLVRILPVTKEEVKQELQEGFVSAMGHADTANVISNELGINVEVNRISVSLNKGDILLVAQLVGGRLPEGATTLPEGFKFKYLKVELV